MIGQIFKKLTCDTLLDNLGKTITKQELIQNEKSNLGDFQNNDSRLRFMLKKGEWSYEEYQQLINKVLDFHTIVDGQPEIYSIICNSPPRQEYLLMLSSFKSGGDFSEAGKEDQKIHESQMESWKNNRAELDNISSNDFEKNKYIQFQIGTKGYRHYISHTWWFFIKENPKCIFLHFYGKTNEALLKFYNEFIIFDKRYDMCCEIICECKNGEK